jgi:GDP-L-fucose synthase
MKKLNVYVAGHRGMVGAAICRILSKKNINLVVRTKNKLDLTNQKAVKNFFEKEKIDQVYIAAAKVGGIFANNKFPAEFIYENLVIQANIINYAFLGGVKKLLFLGSSCIYPKLVKQPIREEMLLTGSLEPTNEPYSIAKIAGIKLCESYNRQYGISHNIDYRCLMPTNLYGIGDDYHQINSHVIPGLIRKFYDAKKNKKHKVVIWGTGYQRRDFLYVDDLASACYHVMNLNKKTYKANVKIMSSHINIGSGSDLTIKNLSEIIKKIVGYKGQIKFDKSKPDGMKRKILDITLIKKLGWKPKYNLNKGLQMSYKDFLKRYKLL